MRVLAPAGRESEALISNRSPDDSLTLTKALNASINSLDLCTHIVNTYKAPLNSAFDAAQATSSTSGINKYFLHSGLFCASCRRMLRSIP